MRSIGIFLSDFFSHFTFFNNSALLRSPSPIRDYEVWHDECKKDGRYWHGLLFVPVDERDEIIALLRKIRELGKHPQSIKLGFAKCHDRTKSGNLVRANLGLFALLTRRKMEPPHDIFINCKKDFHTDNYFAAVTLDKLYSIRFGLMHVPDNHRAMEYFSRYSDKVETTCRFLLKASLHALFSPQEPVRITRFLFDGNQHHDGGIDSARLTQGFEQLRDYVHLDPGYEIDDRGRRERDEESGLAIDFADNLIGGWRAIISGDPRTKHITHPLKDILDRARVRKLHVNPNSRWFKRLSFSEFSIQNGEPCFSDLFRPKLEQATLF